MSILYALLLSQIVKNKELKERLQVDSIKDKKIKAYQVQEEHLVEETPNYKYDLHIPVILGVENEALNKLIDDDIKNDVNRFIEELKKVANEYIILSTPYTLESTYEIYQNDQDIVSFCIVFSNYYGGAHGMEYKKCYNYDVKKGKRLKLMDLFNESEYKMSIDEVISKEIKKRNEAMGYEVINAFKGIKDDQNFYIKDGQLNIYFDLYEIAPYVAGIIEFKLPKSIYSIKRDEMQ